MIGTGSFGRSLTVLQRQIPTNSMNKSQPSRFLSNRFCSDSPIKPRSRFATNLLGKSSSSLWDAVYNIDSRQKYREEVFNSFNLVPSKCTAGQIDSADSYLRFLANLVVEEAIQLVVTSARHTLKISSKDHKENRNRGERIEVLQKFGDKHYFCKVIEPSGREHTRELNSGALVLFKPRGKKCKQHNAYFGFVQFCSQAHGTYEKGKRFSAIFHCEANLQPSKDMEMFVVCSVLNLQRQFKACQDLAEADIPFQTEWLPQRPKREMTIPLAVDSIFKRAAEWFKGMFSRIEKNELTACEPPLGKAMESRGDSINIPILNDKQEKAASDYLYASDRQIQIVQGPPGTGKTTMLCAIICRLLRERRPGTRLLVCGPSNKSLVVLARKVLKCVEKEPSLNVVIIGDRKEMLSDYPNLIDHFVFTYRQQKTIQFQRLFETLDLDLFEAGAERLMAEMRSRLPTICHLKLSQSLQAIRQVLKQKNPDRKAFRRLTKNAKKIVQNLDNQRIVQDLLQTADVVFCTLSTAGSNPVQRTGEFSDLIIDEASACTEPEVLISLCKRPKRMLLVGDPSQLPVMVHSLEAAKQGLTVSLQERLMFQNGNPYTMLDKQYRMSPAISKWPTAQFYQGKLVDAPAITVHDNTPDHPLLLNEYPYTWVNIPGEELKDENHSTFNEAELGAIVSVILDWQKSNSIPDTWLSSPDHIRVVTFYKAQADYLSMEFERLNIGVTVSTVDATQGCEADIVVLSFVRGTTGHMGFIKNLRRLNVALTRARRQLVCVGNLSAILELKEEGANLVLRDMAEDAFERADVIEWSVESRFFIQNE